MHVSKRLPVCACRLPTYRSSHFWIRKQNFFVKLCALGTICTSRRRVSKGNYCSKTCVRACLSLCLSLSPSLPLSFLALCLSPHSPTHSSIHPSPVSSTIVHQSMLQFTAICCIAECLVHHPLYKLYGLHNKSLACIWPLIFTCGASLRCAA